VTPAAAITLKWETFTEAADQAGMSRRYGGIHFRHADLAGGQLGRLVAAKAWSKSQTYFDGTAKYVAPAITTDMSALAPATPPN
jgi:hypothetical protein